MCVSGDPDSSFTKKPSNYQATMTAFEEYERRATEAETRLAALESKLDSMLQAGAGQQIGREVR